MTTSPKVEPRFLEASSQLVREPFDPQPVFYAIVDGEALASTSWSALLDRLRAHGVETTIDRDYLIAYLREQCPDTSRTLCRQIRLLRAGETLGSMSIGAWRPRRAPFPVDEESPTETIVGLLRDEIESLDPDRTCFHLSAGLDSSLLVSLAAQTWSGTKTAVATCRTRGNGVSDEIDLVESLADRLGCVLTIHDLTQVDVLATARTLGSEILDYPIAHPSHLTRYLLDDRIRSAFDVVVTGRGPDEVLAGYPWHGEDYADSARHRARRTVTSDAVLRSILRRPLPIAPERDAEAPRLSLRDRMQFDLWSIGEAWNVIDASLEARLGMTVRAPFMRQEIQRRLWSLGNHHRLREIGGTTYGKWWMRSTFASIYPSEFLAAPKRGLRMDLQPYLVEHTAASIVAAILDGPLGELHLDRKGVETLVEDTLSRRTNAGWQIWSLLLCAHAGSRIESTVRSRKEART